MRGLVVLFYVCLSFVGATALSAYDESDKWFGLRQQAAQLFEANAVGDAEKILQQTLEMTAASGNREHRLASLRELGMVYEREGKFPEARTLFQEALQLQERLYGPDYPEVALTLNYLGVAERELKNFKEAVAAHQRALIILEGQNPANEKLLATTHLALAIAYDGLDLSNEPEEHYRKALKLSQGGRGLENIGLTRVYIRLGRLSAEHGNLQEARQFIKRAEKGMSAKNDPNSPDWMAYFDTRAAISFYLGKYTEADRDWRQAVEVGEKRFGAEDPNVVTMILRRGELHLMMGEYKAASSLLQKCLQIRERVLSPDDPDIAVALTHLAVIHTKQREYVQAAKLFERAFHILESRPQPPNLYMSLTLSGQGEFFAAQGAWSEAAKAFKRALQLREATLGKTHPAVLDTMWAYAKVLAKNKQKDEARMYEERVRDAMAHSGDIVAARKNTVDVRTLRAAGPSGRF